MGTLIYFVIIFFGIFMGNTLTYFSVELSHIKIYKYSNCDVCNMPSSYFFPLYKYIKNKGRCSNCNSKLSILPIITELVTPILFVISFANLNTEPLFLNYVFNVIFISTLIMVFICDSRYMLIQDSILVISGIALVLLKIGMGIYNESITNFLDVGYQLIFFFYEGFFLFLIMYFIKLVGDKVFKKDTMGYGDVKLMFFVSVFLGWRLSIVVLFLSSFLALPESIYNMAKKNGNMLAFGPYIVISSLILFMSNIDFPTLISYIK